MICKQCGKEITNHSKFCQKCGARLSEDLHMILGENNTANPPIDNSVSKSISHVNNDSQYNLSFPKRVLSIIICLFVVTLTILSSIICVIRIGMQKENIRSIISNENVIEIKVNDEYLSDYIISNLNQTIATKYNITTSQIDEILGNEQVKDMITSIVTDYTAMFIFGDKPRNLNENMIIKDIQSLDNLVFSETGYHFSEQDYADIRKELSSGNLIFLVEDNIKDTFGINPYVISMFFSVPATCIFIAIDLGLIVLLFKVNDWKIKSTFAFLGISWILSGTLSVLATLFMIIISLINKMFMISALLRSLALTMLIIAAIFLVVGLLLFIIQNKLIKINR